MDICLKKIITQAPRKLTLKLGFLHDLDFTDKHIMERIDTEGIVLNVLADAVGDTKINNIK